MRSLILSRLGLMVPVLLLASILIFVLTQLMPVDPVTVVLGDGATQESIEQLRSELGLDRPLPVQYFDWLWNALRGDFGDSLFARQSVIDMISDRIGVTISLSFAGIAFALVVGLAVGAYSALHAGSLIDRFLAALNALGIAVPSFWLGLLLALVFGVQLGWFPVIGYTPFTTDPVQWARTLVLPGVALGVNAAAVIARQTRSAMRDMRSTQFVLAMRARGVSERRIVWRYVFKNAMIPVLAVIGIQVPIIVGGTLVVEQVFSQAGLGTLLTEAVMRSDPYILQGGVLTIVVFVLLLNLVIDIAYGAVDPRVQSS